MTQSASAQGSGYESARFAEEYQRRREAEEARTNLWLALGGLAVTLITGTKVMMKRRREEEAADDEPDDEPDDAPDPEEMRQTDDAHEESLLADAAPPPRVGPDKKCPSCGAANAGTWKVCDECNAPLE
jgi:hypothetical protein